MPSTDQLQTLGDHINILRGCILRSLLFLCVGFMLIFLFFSPEFMRLVFIPVRSYSIILGRVPDVGNLIIIHVLDKFVITLLISILGAFFLSVPYTFYEFWKFIRPAMTGKEKHVFISFFPFVMFFFIVGALFGFLIVIPVSIDFLANFSNDTFVLSGIETSITALSYLKYFFIMTFFLGIIFELPLLMMLIVRVTDLEPRDFSKFRRHFIVLSFIIAMLLTPPDVVTQIMLALPMILMYEIGIVLTRFAQKRKAALSAQVIDLKNNDSDFENEKPADDEKDKIESAKLDVITGFTQEKPKNTPINDFENKQFSNDNKYGNNIEIDSKNIQTLNAESSGKVSSKEYEKYYRDSAFSALTKDQIQAILRLIEEFCDKRHSSE